MQRIKQILEDLLHTGNIEFEDYLYLQNHKDKVLKTSNLDLIEYINESMNEPNFKFKKVI